MLSWKKISLGRYSLGSPKFPDRNTMFSAHTIQENMRALVYDSSGPDKLAWKVLHKVSKPGKGQVLVRVSAASLNPFDIRVTESQSLFMQNKGQPLGRDFAGTIVALGPDVHNFAIGEKVFGLAPGCSQYTIADVHRIEKIPGDCDERDFAAVAFTGVVAHQILARHWLDRPEFTVRNLLVIGASGGVGSCILQIVRAIGGPEIVIYGICSGKNCTIAKGFGANHTFDYSLADFNISTILPERSVDLIIDLVSGIQGGPNYVSKGMTLLKPSGRYVALNSTNPMEWVRAYLTNSCGCNVQTSRYDLFSVNQTRPSRSLHIISNLLKEKKLKPYISREVPLADAPLRRALHSLKQGHTRGKILVVPEQHQSTPV
jgi:NADPH:quinone reductase-like Zn-dependent oxidoreductase